LTFRRLHTVLTVHVDVNKTWRVALTEMIFFLETFCWESFPTIYLSDDENDFLSTINLNELFNENQQIKPTATVRLEDGSAKQEPEDAKLAAEQAEDLMEDFVNDLHNFQAPKRFKSFEEDINKIEGKNQSSSTRIFFKVILSACYKT